MDAVASRSLWPAIVAHLLNNATLVLAGKWGSDSFLGSLHDPESPDRTLVVGVSAVLLGASLALVVGLRRGSVEDTRAELDGSAPPP